MKTNKTPKKIKHVAIRPTLLNMPAGSSLLIKYNEMSSVTAFQMAVSRLNRDKSNTNEYEYRQDHAQGGFLVRRIK